MLNEIKILFNNIKNFRKVILNEGVSENRLADAINAHEVLYLYYAGDDTVKKGYRTIKPFVLGTNNRGDNDVVLRAWQDAGSSDSYNKVDGVKPRMGHEKHSGPHGIQPGWRLFKVNGFSSLLPTGKRFDPRKYFTTGDGVNYNPNDKDMSNITAAIPKSGARLDKKVTDASKFFKSAEKAREITKDEVVELLKFAREHRKEAYHKFFVVELENGEMVLKTQSAIQRENIQKDAIVGNLRDLYLEHVVGPKRMDIFDKEEQNIEREIERNRKK